MALKKRGILPGFGLSMGYSVFYLSVIVIIPLSTIFIKSWDLSVAKFWAVISDPRAVASYRLTFGAAFAGAAVNSVFGLIVAWVIVRYEFPGRKILDALIDLPFAMPTAVAGITLTTLYSGEGWIGRFLEPHGIRVSYTPAGIALAMIFIGLPFVVRTIQPVLEDLDPELEESSAFLGAGRLQTFRRVIFPVLLPALLTGFALSFARALGEYGSVVFISGNMPMKTEITTFLIITKLEQFEYAEATAIAVTMLAASFIMLLVINVLQRWGRVRMGGY